MKRNSSWIVVVFGLWFVFAATANAGIATVIRDFEFLKLLYYVGSAVIAAFVAIKVTKIKLEQHGKAIEKIETRMNGFDRDLKQKLYNKDGSTIYMLKKECDKEQADKERRHDDGQRILFDKMEKLEERVGELTKSQNKLAESVSNLVGRFDQYLDGEEKRNKG